jgi:ABC-type phosphate transport system permease subunit
MKIRMVRVFAMVLAAMGGLLFLSDLVVRDQALPLAAFGLLAAAAVLGILLMPTIRSKSDDAWSTIPWGKLFVAIVYASLAIACLAAMAHTADAGRFLHAVYAAL